MMNSNSDYVGVLLEEIRSQNQAVLEAVGDMQQKVNVLPQIESDITALKQDMKITKAAIPLST